MSYSDTKQRKIHNSQSTLQKKKGIAHTLWLVTLPGVFEIIQKKPFYTTA